MVVLLVASLRLALAAPAPAEVRTGALAPQDASRGGLAPEDSSRGALPPETDLPYAGAARFSLGGTVLRLEGRRVLLPDGAPLVGRLLGPPAWDAAHLCAADEGADGLGQLRCWDAALRPVTLQVGGRPGRIALGGAMVAWVASPAGLPQVFVAPVDGAAPPRALTNAGLQPRVGGPPGGFVPPPLRDSLRFDGASLRWDSPDGPRSVRWR